MDNTDSAQLIESKNSSPLKLVGLLTIIAGFATLFTALAFVFPPWNKVQCQRRQILYWSEIVQTNKKEFAGFDFIWSKAKRKMVKDPPNPNSETKFRSVEFQINRVFLGIELTAVALLSLLGFILGHKRYLSTSG